MSFNIIGAASAFPKKHMANEEFTEFLETSDEWIYTRTGIKKRYVATDEHLVDFATKSAEKALINAKTAASELDFIIFATMGGDYATPSHACMVQKRIGANCPALDINSACTGFLYALDVASAYLDSGKAKKILVVCAELMSLNIDWTDRGTCVLFGDGAASIVLEKGDGLLSISVESDGNDEILVQGGPRGNNPFLTATKKKEFVVMDGKEIFKFAVSKMINDINMHLDKCNLTFDDIKAVIPHQANARIISAAAGRMGDSEGKFICQIENYGNTVSATIPIVLSNMLNNGELVKGDIIALSAFGGGLTSGACIIKI